MLLFLCCTELEKEDFLENCARFLLYRPIKKHSFNALCVLDLLILLQNAGSQLSVKTFILIRKADALILLRLNK